MLNFIGRGSAFNTAEGNNAAFIRKGSKLLLIDCGSDTFSSIQRLNLLEGIDEINVLITHTHPDHVGSLGDLIFYSYYMMGNQGLPSLTVYSHSYHEIDSLLERMGIASYMYHQINMHTNEQTKIRMEDYIFGIIPIRTKHTSDEFRFFPCLGFFIHSNKDNPIYYSGDSNMIPEAAKEALLDGSVTQFYQDTSGADYEGNVHLSYRKLLEEIPAELRDRVYCMHLDQSFDYLQAQVDGFNVVRRYGSA